MTEKKCKHCASMVPATARICPHCRKRLKTSLLTKIVFVLVLLALPGYFVGLMRTDTPQSAKQPVEEVLTSGGKRVKQKYPAWPNRICNTIAKKQVGIGMNADQVRASWGKPEKINSTIMRGLTREQWVYDSQYVYLDNGRVVTIQTH